jgi:hypothetical protein
MTPRLWRAAATWGPTLQSRIEEDVVIIVLDELHRRQESHATYVADKAVVGEGVGEAAAHLWSALTALPEPPQRKSLKRPESFGDGQ